MAIEILQERYKIQKQLGKKARRLTLLAQDLQTQQLVTVKILGLDRLEEGNLARYHQELALLKPLQHPAIPPYLDSFDQDLRGAKGFAIVQAYVPSQSIKEHLQAGKVFTESEAKQIACQILDALAYLHGLPSPVLHRNIRPSNILVSQGTDGSTIGQAYLVDFGSLQTSATPDDSSSTIVSSYEYTPPEQFAGNKVAASDLYSFGTTLITALTGKLISDLPRRGPRVQFEEAVSLSPEFADWLKRMTEVNLLTRLPSAKLALTIVSMM